MTGEHITGRRNPVIAEAVRLLNDTGYRKGSGLIAAEGTKLLADAAESGAEIRTVIVSEGMERAVPPLKDCRIVIVPEKLFKAISTQKSPQGVLFFCMRPDHSERMRKGRYLVLDGVQDPGNTGTVIRTAAAFGADGVVVCGNGADPFGPKAVRASMGAIFRIPVRSMTPRELKEECENAGIPLFAAMPSGEAIDIRDMTGAAAAVVIGNEGSGVSDEIKSICGGTVGIPMAKGTESLNAAVAAAVILWELNRHGL